MTERAMSVDDLRLAGIKHAERVIGDEIQTSLRILRDTLNHGDMSSEETMREVEYHTLDFQDFRRKQRVVNKFSKLMKDLENL